MPSWATDYLGAEILPAGETVVLEFAPGCYITLSEWEGGATMQEEVLVTAGMTHSLEIDV